MIAQNINNFIYSELVLPTKLRDNLGKLILPENILSVSNFLLLYPYAQGWVDFVPTAIGFKVLFNIKAIASIIDLQLPLLQINPISLALYKQRSQYNNGWPGFIEEFSITVCHYDTHLAGWLAALIITNSHKAKPIVNLALNAIGVTILEQRGLSNEFVKNFL